VSLTPTAKHKSHETAYIFFLSDVRPCSLVEVCRHSDEYAASILCPNDKRQYGSLKYRYISTTLHGVISQKPVHFIAPTSEIRNLRICVDLPHTMSTFCIKEYSIMHLGTPLTNTDLLTSKVLRELAVGKESRSLSAIALQSLHSFSLYTI
jgi:hypothetical protein